MTGSPGSEFSEQTTETDSEPLVSLRCESHTYPDGTVGISVGFTAKRNERLAVGLSGLSGKLAPGASSHMGTTS